MNRTTRPTVWGVPSPWSGDESDQITWTYWIWVRTYWLNQRIRHRLGLHQKPPHYSIAPRCDWCGHRSAKQRETARRNAEAAS